MHRVTEPKTIKLLSELFHFTAKGDQGHTPSILCLQVMDIHDMGMLKEALTPTLMDPTLVSAKGKQPDMLIRKSQSQI